MTYLPYPDDPARLAATNPIFNDNSFVRGDEQRLNNSEIWANFSALDTELISQDTRLDTIESTYFYRGLINGSVEFDTASTFPTVKAGVYEVNGKLIYKTSDTNIGMADTFFDNRQAIDTNVGYLILMDDSGTIKYLMYGEGIAQASQAVTNITGTTTKTLTVPTVPGAAAEEYVALISGTGSFTGAFKATRASATTFTIVLDSDLGSSFTGMTVTLYYKIRTLHGTGALANKTDSTSIVYSPSLGENTETNSFALFDSSKNGFYCTLSGLTDYRVIGSIAGAATASTLDMLAVFSFKSGRNKNDNFLKVNSVSAFVTNAPRWSNFEIAYGCDYVFYINDATFGSAYLLRRGGFVNSRLQVFAGSAGLLTAFINAYLNSTNYTAFNTITTTGEGAITATGVTTHAASIFIKAGRNSVIKPLVSSTTTATASIGVKFVCNLEVNS